MFVCTSATHVFIGLMADALMAREVIAEREIVAAFVGHHRGFASDVRTHDGHNVGYTHAIDFPIPQGIQISVEKQTKRGGSLQRRLSTSSRSHAQRRSNRQPRAAALQR